MCKMKPNFIFLFLVFMINLGLASAALSPSPGKLYFNTEINARSCEKITLSSLDYKGDIKIRDVWATSINEGANINKYTATASDFGITLEYSEIIENFSGSKEVEVCLTQTSSTKSKGGIIFTPGSETNVVVEYGTWLLVNIDEPKPISDTPTKSTTSPTSNTNSNTNPASNTGEVVLGIEENKQNIEEEKVEINNQVTANGITGAAIGTSNRGISTSTIIIILAIIGAFIALLSYRRSKSKRRMMEYGY